MSDRWSRLETAAAQCVKPSDCVCGGTVYAIAHTWECADARVEAWDDFLAVLTVADVLELIRLARVAEGVPA